MNENQKYWATSYIEAEIHDKEGRLKEAETHLQNAKTDVKVCQDAVDRYSAELRLLKILQKKYCLADDKRIGDAK